MRPQYKFYILLITYTFYAGMLSAQSYKQQVKQASALYETSQYEQAIDILNNAVSVDADKPDAYHIRALCYWKRSAYNESVADFDKALQYDSENPEILLHYSQMLSNKGDYDKALLMAQKIIALKPKHIEGAEQLVHILILQKNYQLALSEAEKCVQIKENKNTLYIRGLAYFMLNDYQKSESDLLKAISENSEFFKAHRTIAELYSANNNIEKALEHVNKALQIDDSDFNTYNLRGNILYLKGDYAHAINDASTSLLLKENNREALYIRAGSFEKQGKLSEAINDYKALLVNQDNEEVENFGDLAQQRLFELNRESNKPVIKFSAPILIGKDLLELPDNSTILNFSGIVEDESAIKLLKIGTTEIALKNGTSFSSDISVSQKDKIQYLLTDVYDNTTSGTIYIKRTETIIPGLEILAPYLNPQGKLMVPDNSNNLYIQGNISDQSHIGSIVVNGVVANFEREKLNPSFNLNINIANTNTVLFEVSDKYNNKLTKSFTLDYSGAEFESAMGRTWAIFIENSNYVNFASLTGASEDVEIMKSALSNYQIHNTIHKKDLTKSELEQFFRTELVTLVKANKVRSLIVWYSGHGELIDDKSYWIPIDGDRSNELSYYDITMLKNSLQAYSNNINHTLIINDACDSGPTFYQAMRAVGTSNKDCANKQYTQAKSSQVFSSVATDIAVERSRFTESIVEALRNNENSCIPIEKIVESVTNDAQQRNQEIPRFGLINGMPHEDGTFFFIAK